MTIKQALQLFVLALGLCLTSCGSGDARKLDQVTLSPGESKNYSLDSKEPMRVGILLSKDVSGGTVELQQIGSVSKTGTGHYWISDQWQPKDNKVDLKLINNSATRVEVIVFTGQEPPKHLLNQ